MANEMVVEPTRWSPRGEAIASLPNGKELHLWNSIVGERAEVRVAHRGQNQWAGYYIHAKKEHPERVIPRARSSLDAGGVLPCISRRKGSGPCGELWCTTRCRSMDSTMLSLVNPLTVQMVLRTTDIWSNWVLGIRMKVAFG